MAEKGRGIYIVYKICEHFMEDLEKKLKRIGKKCAKHGNPFTYNVVGTEYQEREDEYKNKIKYKFYLVEVEGTARIDDWECVASIEIHPSGNIIRNINTTIEVPKRFWHTENVCEHCNTRRQRKNLYIVHNVKTDEYRQVGKNCLLEYTDGLNAEYVASFIDGITELEEFDGFIGGGGEIYFDVKDVIGRAAELINKVGYFNSDAGDISTRYCVEDIMAGNYIAKIDMIERRFHYYHFDNVSLKSSDFYKPETDEKVEKIIEYYKGLDAANSDFIHNIQVFLKDGCVKFRDFGYVCYLPAGYDKYIQREIARAERVKADGASKHFGEVKKRYKDVKAITFDTLFCYNNQWGGGYCHKITLEGGEQLIWKTSKSAMETIAEDQKINYDKIDFDDWLIESATFTVKNHGEYKGTAQTDVTRVVTKWKKRESNHPTTETKNVLDVINDWMDELEESAS